METVAETRMVGLVSLGAFVGLAAFFGWLFRPPPRCTKRILWGQSTYPCHYFEGHAGRCVPDWSLR